MRELLRKYYSNIQFYLTYDRNQISILNWKLHTEDDVKLLIPTGLSVDKVISLENT